MDDPLVQAVLLPLVLALACGWVLNRLQARAEPGATASPPPAWVAWAARCRPAAAAALAAGVAGGLLVGWGWPPSSLAAWLPWVAVGAALCGLVLDGLVLDGLDRRSPAAPTRLPLAAMPVAALGVVGGLMAAGPASAVAWAGSLALAAAVILALALSESSPQRINGCVGAAVAAGGLAALLAASGSLLLGQAAAVLGFALGGLALGLWPRPRPWIGHGLLLLAAWGWLALALAGTRLTAVTGPQVALLALALLPAALLPRLLRRAATRRPAGLLARVAARPALEAVLTGLVAAGVAAAALAIALLVLGPAPGSSGTDDDYYTPDWSN